MFKYRLYPNKTQEATLEHQLDLCRWTYNRLLLHCRSTNKKTGKLPTLFDLNKLLVKLKTENLEFRAGSLPDSTEHIKADPRCLSRLLSEKEIWPQSGLAPLQEASKVQEFYVSAVRL